MNPDVAILVTVIAGEALNKIQGVSDEDVVEQCMAALKNMFPEHVSSIVLHTVWLDMLMVGTLAVCMEIAY